MTKLTVLDTTVSYSSHKDEDNICLTDMARYRDTERVDYIIQNWMRNRNTIEFPGLWEQSNNPGFKSIEFDGSPLLTIRRRVGKFEGKLSNFLLGMCQAMFRRLRLLSLVTTLVLSAAGTASAASWADVDGLWMVAVQPTIEHLQAIGHPNAEKAARGMREDSEFGFRVDTIYNQVVYYRRQGRRALPPLLIKKREQKGDTFSFELESHRANEKNTMELILVGKGRLIYALNETPLVFIKQPARKARDEAELKPLTGRWLLDRDGVGVIHNIKVEAKATNYSDGHIAITVCMPVAGKDTYVTRKIPFSVAEITPQKASLHIYAAPPFRTDNGHGGSYTFPIEEFDMPVIFNGPQSIQVEIPAFQGQLIPLKRK